MLCVQQLTGQQATPDHAALLLDDYFATTHDTTTVLLADEVMRESQGTPLSMKP